MRHIRFIRRNGLAMLLSAALLLSVSAVPLFAVEQGQIGAYAYREDAGLTELILPEGITAIGVEAFASCVNLKKVTLPATLTSLAADAFSGCTAITEIQVQDMEKNKGSLLNGLTGLPANVKITYLPDLEE